MILIAGATGHLGGAICRRLAATGRPVRGLVRATSDAEAVSHLRTLGIDPVEGDLRDRESVKAVCQGVTAVVSTVTTVRSRQPGDSIETTDRDGQLNLIEAARGAGVERFIYVSYSGQIGVDDPLTRAKRDVERRLRTSGITYTILRPSYFMQTWLSPALGFDFGTSKATVYGSGSNRISWVSLEDVAELAVRSMDHPDAVDATIDFGGPDALSPLEVIRVFEDLSGMRFEVQHVPEDALATQRDAATNSLEQAFAALMLAYAKGDEIPMPDIIGQLKLRLTSVREYARDVLRP